MIEMRILLINSPFSRGYYSSMPPLGLAYIASVLRQGGHSVKIVDMNVSAERLPSRFDNFDLVGISSDTPRHNISIQIAKKAKEQKTPVIMGGPHVTFMDEESLKSGAVDYVVRGEGEYSMLNLVEHLSSGDDVKDVAGISYLKSGDVVRNPNHQLIADLDILPLPARELLPMNKYTVKLGGWRATSVITSRGCPFNCSFCSSSELFGLRWRAREPEAIVDEVEQIKEQYNIDAILFMDDNFTLNPNRTIRICELMNHRNLNIRWWFFSRVDTIVNREDMVQSMADAGALTAFVGVESPNQDVLNDYKKGITADISYRAIQILRKYKIRSVAGFIIGGLNETREMIKDTIKFAIKWNPDIAQFSILTPYPGTRLFESVKGNLLTHNWAFHNVLHEYPKFPLRRSYNEKCGCGDYRRKCCRSTVRYNMSGALSRKECNADPERGEGTNSLRDTLYLYDYR